MAKEISEYQQEILDEVAADPVLSSELTSVSKVAKFRLWSYIQAVGNWSIAKLQDTLRKETDEKLAAQKNFKRQFYVDRALVFQYGYSLVAEKDYYDNTGISESLIEA